MPRAADPIRALLAGALAALAGCSTPPGPTPAASFTFDAATYEEAFDAAKDVLREMSFDLDRVDARRGVITTRARSSSGFMTPWIAHADSSEEAVEGVLHRDRRTAIVNFRAADPPAPIGSVDLREFDGLIYADVEVIVERAYVAGRRPEPTSIRMTSFTIDPSRAGAPAGGRAVELAEVGADAFLAARLADRIRERTGFPAPGP